MPTIIKPSNGRKVWYVPSEADLAGSHGMQVQRDAAAAVVPLDATVIAVWGDRMVNLLVTDIVGRQYPKLSVTLVQDGDPPPSWGGYACWMPYQTGQAKKHEGEDAKVGGTA